MIEHRLYQTPYGDVAIGDFEEVLAIPRRYLNDHCLVHNDGLWHFFGIVGNRPEAELNGLPSETSFAHATSDNLRDWDVHPDVMACAGVWPELVSVIAPFVIEHDGLFHMLYAGIDEHGTQRICLATSRDLWEWERYADNPVIVPSVSWSKWPGFGLDAPDGKASFGGCRDPHVIRLDGGGFVAYWVSLLQDRFGPDMVCVAASISHNLVNWQEVGPVFSMRAWHRPCTREVESPCVVAKDGRYWLFFKHGWWTNVVASDSPFDFGGCEPMRLGYSHAAEVLHWNGQWWITHCKTDPDDFMCQTSDLTGGLFLGRLDWPDGAYPRLIGAAASERDDD